MTQPVPTIVVELFGVPRERAGQAELTVRGRTVKEAIEALCECCPPLRGMCENGSLNSNYLLSLDGKRFIADLNQPLPTGARLLILGADAGG
jgi:molybdopterin converting factor small subunit